MQLDDLAQDLARRGLALTAPTTLVPVDLWSLTSRLDAVQLRCRGTDVRLRLWRRSDLARAEAGDCVVLPDHPVTTTRLVPLAGAEARSPAGRLVVRPGAHPAAEVRVDGARRFGWQACEAGRLSPAEALAWLDRLLPALGTVPASGAAAA